jgi:beta-glucosidase
MGFEGFVVSDCGAVENLVDESHWSPNISSAVAESIIAGNDVNCGPSYASIPSVVAEGLLSQPDVDRALSRVLTVRFRLGVFNPPEDSPFAHINMTVVGSAQHVELATEAARQGIVLLKNERSALPLNAKALQNVAIIGPQCDDELVLLGNYHGTPTHAPITPLAAIAQALGSNKVQSSPGCWVQGEGTWRFGDAVQMAAAADVAVVFVGSSSKGTNISQPNLLAPATEKESLDRTSLLLPGVQLDLIKAIAKRTQTPIVVVLVNGGAIDIEWLVQSDRVSAILEAW